jgi:hypothetical protein
MTSPIKALRTPEERFSRIKDFPYRPNYIEVPFLLFHPRPSLFIN